jgi:hypothetical protein
VRGNGSAFCGGIGARCCGSVVKRFETVEQLKRGGILEWEATPRCRTTAFVKRNNERHDGDCELSLHLQKSSMAAEAQTANTPGSIIPGAYGIF